MTTSLGPPTDPLTTDYSTETLLSKAAYFVVVHHANCLHESVRNRRTDEAKTVFFAFSGQHLRFQGF